jgi:hypothetical protein
VYQDAWSVDAVNGDDRNPGTLARPVKSLAALGRIWHDAVFAPDIPLVTLSLVGTFPAEALSLTPDLPGGGLVDIRGQMTQVLASVSTAYQAEAPPVRQSISDGVTDFSLHLGKRIRITDGASLGATAYIQAAPVLGTAQTTAFTRYVPATGAISNVNPAVGSAFVVESHATVIDSFQYTPYGNALHTLTDLGIMSAGAATESRNVFGQISPSPTARGVRVHGSRFLSNGVGNSTFLRGIGTVAGCLFEAPLTSLGGPDIVLRGIGWREQLYLESGHYSLQRGQGEGNGARACPLVVHGSTVELWNHWSIFASANPGFGAAVVIEDNGRIIGAVAQETYGTSALCAASLRVANGCGWEYTTLPQLVSAGGAAAEVVLASGAPAAWAPAIAVAPNNAYLNVRQ